MDDDTIILPARSGSLLEKLIAEVLPQVPLAAEIAKEENRRHAAHDREVRTTFPYDPDMTVSETWAIARRTAAEDAASMDLEVIYDSVYWTASTTGAWVDLRVSYDAFATEEE